jgi:GMP synthase (glutamine-hydrolysing)
MPVVACVHHLERPFLGPAGSALSRPDVEVLHVHRRRGDALPALERLDGIISFGGEQSARDLAVEPALAAETAWLAEAIAAGVPVLGVCLGAQLLARALGAEVFRLARPMLSWEPLEPTAAGARDPLIAALGPGAHGVQWNEDGFDLPPGAVELVERTAPSCQAFAFGERCWGVQFHPDVDPAALDHWYAEWTSAPADAGTTLAAARAADAHHLVRHREDSEALFAAFLDVVRRHASGGHGVADAA